MIKKSYPQTCWIINSQWNYPVILYYSPPSLLTSCLRLRFFFSESISVAQQFLFSWLVSIISKSWTRPVKSNLVLLISDAVTRFKSEWMEISIACCTHHILHKTLHPFDQTVEWHDIEIFLFNRDREEPIERFMTGRRNTLPEMVSRLVY